MRPRLLARAAIPGLHRMAPGPGGGWLTIKINSNFAQVYDKTLALTHSTPIPAAQWGSGIAADAHITVLTRTDTITAVHHDGAVAWRMPVTGETEPTRSHLDPDGTLWLHLTGSHQLRALDITTCHEIDHIVTPPGGSWFTHHARGEWPALNIAGHPPDAIQGWQPRLRDGRIHLRQLTAGGHVTGFAGAYCVINAGMRGQNSLHPAGEAGRWLTRDYRSDVLELWELDGAVNDEIPGQLVLANPRFGPDEQIADQLPLFDV